MDPGGAGLPPVGDINDYGKFGLWHDCLYMAANAFTPSSAYDGVMFASFSRADLYSGAPLTFSIGYLPPSTNAFTLIPSNNQGKGTNAVQPGTPNYFVSESGVVEEFEVRKFSPGPNCGAGGTLSAPTIVSQAQYTFQQGAIVPQPNTSRKLDMIDDRIMQKVQYRKIGGTESLWVTHPVGTSSGPTAMQWAQLDVTGGVIATTPVQQQIYAPDTSLYRFMGSLAVDGKGNMALGYTRSNGNCAEFSEYRLFRQARDRSVEYAAADRSDNDRRRRLADQQLRRRAVRSMGRLQCDERRSRRRLHVLVHQRVLQQPDQRH